MHYDELGLGNSRVSGKYLPDKYFEVQAQRRAIRTIFIKNSSSETIFVGTDHGLFRTDDLGQTWKELKEGLFNQDIRSLVVPANKDNILYAGTARGIFKSEDGGETFPYWIEETTGLINLEINSLAGHPEDPEKLYAATAEGLFVTDDGGENWDLIFSAKNDITPNIQMVHLTATEPQTLILGTDSGAYRSTDGGSSWNRVWIDEIPNITMMISLNTDPEFLYIVSGRGLHKSFNNGRSWILDSHKKIKNLRSVFIDPENISKIYAGTDDRILVSDNGGDTWNKELKIVAGDEPSPQSIDHIQSIRSGRQATLLLAGTGRGLYLSNNNAETWTVSDFSDSSQTVPRENMDMDLVKLITEIHTGRFFGSYFMLLVDIATLGLVVLVFSGCLIGFYRNMIKKRKQAGEREELETDLIIDIQETADDLSHESMEIHDMIEHIGNHLDKCKTIYLNKEKREIEEIDRHITTLDKKMHHLMERIGEFERTSQN